MSSQSSTNLIDEWERLGWEWHVIHEPKRRPFQLQPSEVRVVPTQTHRFWGEGILQDFSASFDSPLCGIRIRDGTELDSRDTWNIRDLMAVQYPSQHVHSTFVVVPPYTPYGIYYIERDRDWYWKDWIELALFNIDSSPHWVLGYGYEIALTRKREQKPTYFEKLREVFTGKKKWV